MSTITTQAKNNKDNFPRFPIVRFAIAITLTIITLLWFGIYSNQMVNHFKDNLDENQELELSGVISQLDEALTMSANMAAVTGDLKWVQRYDYYSPQLDQAIKGINLIVPNEFFLNDIKKIDLADQRLITIEKQALDFVKQKKLIEAQGILNTPEYKNQKAIYTKNIQDYIQLIRKQALNELNTNIQKSRYILIAISLTFIFSFLIWFITYKSIREWKKNSESSISAQLEYDKKLKEEHDLLEKRIQERTSELNNKNQDLFIALRDLKLAQKNLIQSEKMAMIGQLSAGIAHEINNPLSFVISNIDVLHKRLKIISQLLEMYHSLSSQIKPLQINALENSCNKIISFYNENKIPAMVEDIDSIINESTDGLIRIKKIVSNLGSFSNVNKDITELVNINDCIESAIEIVLNALKYKIELHKNLSDLPKIKALPDQLKLVFMNLLLNSVQSVQDKGEINLTSKVVDSNIVVTVTDNGCGIAPENLSKIFTPFFTTKSIGTGTGLGLAAAYGIIQLHGGNITVKSTLGSGSTFTIELPINDLSQ